MINKQQYIEYLLNTPINYTCSNLADHLEGVSHDAVSDFLQRGRVTANRLWEKVEPLLNNTEEAVLIVDDSVQNKQYSQQIGLVQRQYSGAEVCGLGELVACDFVRSRRRDRRRSVSFL